MSDSHPEATDVVVTGIGCLGAYGVGLDALRQALAQGEAAQRPVDRSAGYHRRGSATKVASCGDLQFEPWLSEDAGRRMSDLSQYAVTCARMALAHAELADLPAERTSVTIATAFGPGGFTERLALQVLQRGGKFASPFLFTDCVANAAAGQIAIAIGARGPNNTICQREAGPLLALGQAWTDLTLGRADVCLAGAIDELKPLSHAILDRFRALARPIDGDPEREQARPFASSRNGYLAGEGGTVLVLERAEHAARRSARVLARLGPTVRAFDPSAPRTGHGTDSAGLAAKLERGLGARRSRIQTVVSGASGARRGDALEAEILTRVLPDVTAAGGPRVLAPKAVTGEFGGGTLAAALLAVEGADFAQPAACRQADDTMAVPLRGGPTRPGDVLCSAHAAGGTSAWTTLSPSQTRATGTRATGT